MADPVYNVESLIDNIKLALNDVDGNWITDAQYRAFIATGITADSADRIYNKRTTGRYTCDGYHGDPYALLFDNDTTPFTGEADVEYEVDARGSVYIASGTHSTDTITISAGVVDFALIMSDVYHWLAAHRSMDIAQTYGGDSYTPGVTFDHLIKVSDYWRSIRNGEY